MLLTSLFYLILSLFISSTLGNHLENVTTEAYSGNQDSSKSRLEDPSRIYKIEETSTVSINNSSSNTTKSIDESDKPRDKRALGVILQGLAEAFGYTVSPISLSSLPNPNTTVTAAAAAPPPIFTFPDLANPPPAPAAPPPPPPPRRPNPPATMPRRPQNPVTPSGPSTMPARQRETLRFTGVVNFGNNSDILGHLQRYQRIFHGGASTTAAPPPPIVPPTTASNAPKIGLIKPFFVKIPLPLAPNLAPLLPPTAPRNVQQMFYKDSYESDEIKNDKDATNGPLQGNRDTYIDQPEWTKREREEQSNKHRQENHMEDDSSEENEENGEPKNDREKLAEREREDSRKTEPEEDEIDEEEVSEENDKKNNYKKEEKTNDNGDEERKNNDEEDEEDSRERYETKRPSPQEYSKKSEDNEGDNDSKVNGSDDEENEREEYKRQENHRETMDRRNKLENQDYTTARNNFLGYEDPFVLLPRKIPPIPEQFDTRLPIRVYDLPYDGRGEFRNSYGQSLEHDGRIDDSLADYFERYKHPETEIYDSRKILSLEDSKRNDPWWHGQFDVQEADRDPLQKIRQEYAAPGANARYEEYSLEDEEATRQKVPERKKINEEDPEEILEEDERAEPTMTTYSQIRAPEAAKKYSNENNDDADAAKEDDREEPKKSLKSREEDSVESMEKIGKIEHHEPVNPLPFKGFDFIKYSPYFRPLQISYEPEKLQRTADRILAHHNFDEFGEIRDIGKSTTEKNDNDEEQQDRSRGRGNKKNKVKPEVESSERLTGSQPRDGEFYRYSPYVKPIRYVYEPETLQKTADRILSYRNSGQLKKKPEETLDNNREENEELYEEPKVNRSSENLREDQANEDESEVNRSSENLRERDDDEDEREIDRSSENLRQPKDNEDEAEVDRSSENLRQHEDNDDEPDVDRSSENLRENEANEDEPEVDRSSENLRKNQVNQDEPEVNRSSENVRENEDNEDEPEANRSSENLRGNYYEKPEVDDSAENLRERDANENEPGVERSSENLREQDANEDEREVDDSTENLRENSDEKPEVNRSSANVRKLYYEKPEVGLPERLTGRKLHEGENKVIQGWPAPFDHTFDSTESTKIVKNPTYSKIRDEYVEPTYETPVIYKKSFSKNRFPANVSPTYETPSIVELRKTNRTGSYSRDSYVAPTDESFAYEKLPNHKLSENRSRDQTSIRGNTRYYENPEKRYRESRVRKNEAKKIPEPEYKYRRVVTKKSKDEDLTNHPEIYVPEGAKRFSAKERHEKLRKHEMTKNHDNADRSVKKISREKLPERPKTFEGPESAHEFFGLSQDNYDIEGKTSGDRKSGEKIVSKSTTPLTANGEELFGLLIVRHEDPHYQRDVNLTEFTDEPESDTEKVRVKEYRNKVATIKVSERKQLSPDGHVQLIGFTRHF